MNKELNNLEELLNFRSLMGLTLTEEKLKYIWGKKYLKSLGTETTQLLVENENKYVLEKIEICKKEISRLKIFNWVKFIGISGSVAAGFAKEEDDIDIFVVVKNKTMWLYRALVIFYNLFHNKVRAKRHKDVKDKLCLNMICEERGLKFDNDIFNFHELMFLIPVYNEKYINYIYSKNNWLEEKYNVKKENLITKTNQEKDPFIFITVLNQIAFLLQLSFMYISGHRPNTKVLISNNRGGRIEFFMQNYRSDILENYSKRFKSTN